MKPSQNGYVFVLTVLLLSGVSSAVLDAQSPTDGDTTSDARISNSGSSSLDSGGDTWAGDYDTRDATDRFERINTGERIQVRLRNGAQLQGEVIGLLGDRIQLEISNERLTMSGSITLRSERVESITKLDPLTQAERRQIQSIKKQYRANVRSASADTESGNGESDTAGSADTNGDAEGSSDSNDQKDQEKEGQKNDEEKEKEKEKKKEWPPELSSEQQGLLDRFPADEWNEKRYQKLQSKFNFQRNNTQDAFIENWENIKKARKIQEQRREHQLLQEFHPDDGWTPEKYRHIKENLASLEAKGIPARSAKQRRFLEVHDKWKEAYERYKKRQKKNEQEEQDSAEGPSPAPEEGEQQEPSPSPENITPESGTSN